MTEIDFKYAHAAILVSNIERSARFYERAVGWKREFDGSYDDALGRANGYGGPGRILMGKMGGVPLEFVEMQVPLDRKERPKHFGIFMCSVAVTDLEPVRARLKAAEIPITREVEVGNITLLVVTDPDGQEIGIIGLPHRRGTHMSQEAKPPTERIGFVGVGRMGSAMLQCVLKAGYRATLCDPSEQATAPFVADFPDRVRVAPTSREAAQDADVIEIVVNTNEQLLEACSGPDGVFAGARPGSIVLVHSTVSHETLNRLGSVASERGVQMLDAMVSGARGQLSIPNLAVMVGGDAGAFVRAKPVMETYGSLVLHLGPGGAGLDAKLAINLLRYLCMAASQESERLAMSTNVGGAMAQLVAHTEANRYVGDFARLRAMETSPREQRVKDAVLAQKDLRAAIARGAQVGLPLPGAELAVGLMHRLWGVD